MNEQTPDPWVNYCDMQAVLAAERATSHAREAALLDRIDGLESIVALGDEQMRRHTSEVAALQQQIDAQKDTINSAAHQLWQCDGKIATQAQELAHLKGAMRADDARLAAAGERVGMSYGCDTAEWMADRSLAQDHELAQLKAERDDWERRFRDYAGIVGEPR